MQTFSIVLKIFTLLVFSLIICFNNVTAGQDDPVLCPEVNSLPVIDGKYDDACWQNLPWQSIDQVWIEYGTEIPAEDFTGKFKIVWSSNSNLLYFLIEVTDDELVDGFKPGVTADIYNFDLSEIFIDEDNSGGKHVLDGKGNDGIQWGTNAENAFSYHLYADFPEENSVTTSCYAGDIAGSNWSSVNYASHFPEFAMRRNDNTVVREFSLKVYSDAYDSKNPEASRVKLEVNKESGLSMAYCDNDDPNEEPKTRDHFFGSVAVPPAAYNDHWINADYFGTIKLVESAPSGVMDEKSNQGNSFKVYPNPASSFSNLQIENQFTGDISIKLYNLLGEEVFSVKDIKTTKSFQRPIYFKNLSCGLYILTAQSGNSISCEKIIINNFR